MQGDSRPKDFLSHSQPARLSYPSPRRRFARPLAYDSTGIFSSPLPTGTDNLSRATNNLLKHLGINSRK